MNELVPFFDEHLVSAARACANSAGRTVAQQLELWAKLGKALEASLQKNVSSADAATRPISESLADVDAEEGRRRVREYLANGPFPRYEPVPDLADMFIRIDADGTRTKGRFVGRDFREE